MILYFSEGVELTASIAITFVRSYYCESRTHNVFIAN